MKNNACMYLHLSREDGESYESNSISNQRQIIKSYAKEKSFNIIAEYVDDGFSGYNFERPNFKKMIEELENGKFKIIIVKDLSRFGRDYIESGKYLQKIFPEKGIRFISINDNYDSENADIGDTNLILLIGNFINDSYCRYISMKVKSSKEIKRKNGDFIGAFAYLKDESFDYITSLVALGNIPESNKVIRELYRILKPNGKIVIQSSYIEKGSKSFELAKSKNIERGLVEEYLINDLKNAGFKNIISKVVSKAIWAENPYDLIPVAGDTQFYSIIEAQRTK
ncbi:recombinase family protein [Clostridium ihumii]|uniref:recombinase family protein n=1 Tax=Clostridium ihumii TaxID=1470356 RepID=UPI003D331E59